MAALTSGPAAAETYIMGYMGAAFTQDTELQTEVEVNGTPFVNGDAHGLEFDTAPVFGALVSSLPLLWWEAGSGQLIVPDATGWIIVLYAAIFPSLISQVLWVRGVEMIGPNRAGLFINAIPVFGMLLSVLLIGETMQTFHFVAMVLVLGGIAIAEWGRPKQI